MVSLIVVFLLAVLGSVAAFSGCVWLRIEVLRVSNAELIQSVVDQLGRARVEIVDRISALEQAVASGEDLSGALESLKVAAQALDDVVVDVPGESVDGAIGSAE